MIPDGTIFAFFVGWALIASTFATRSNHWSRLHNMESWLCTIAMVGLSLKAPNLPTTLMIAFIGSTLFRPAPVPLAMILIGWRTVMWTALYLLCLPYVTADMIPLFLGLMTGVGCLFGLWTVFIYIVTPVEPVRGQTPVTFTFLGYEITETLPRTPTCNQMNINLTHCIVSVCVACNVALLFYVEHPAILISTAVLVSLPIWITAVRSWNEYGQGWGHGVVILFAALTVQHGWGVWWLGVPCLAVGVWWASRNEGGFQSRLIGWRAMIVFLWTRGKKGLFWGYGMGAWQTFNSLPQVKIQSGTDKGKVMPSAHNEFIQILVEYGAVGVVAVVAVLGYAAMRLSGEPLLIPGMVLVSVAMLNAPWTLTHWHISPHDPSTSTWYGSPSLTVISFAVMVLIDGVYTL